MSVCTYDNPRTMAREAWQDGRLLAHVQAHVLLSRGFRGGPWLAFTLNAGEWEPGKIVGDFAAVEE